MNWSVKSCTFWQFGFGQHKSRHFWWRFCFRWHRHEHNEWDKWQMERDRLLCCHEMTNQTGLTEPGLKMTVCKQAKINLPLPDRKMVCWPWQWKFSWGFQTQRGPNTRRTFPPWLIRQIYPTDGSAIISSAGILFCIHLFEPAGSLIFFCVDYTFMTQFSAITGFRLPLSKFLWSLFCTQQYQNQIS